MVAAQPYLVLCPESDEDDDTEEASASKKRKPGRPKKHSPDRDGQQTGISS